MPPQKSSQRVLLRADTPAKEGIKLRKRRVVPRPRGTLGNMGLQVGKDRGQGASCIPLGPAFRLDATSLRCSQSRQREPTFSTLPLPGCMVAASPGTHLAAQSNLYFRECRACRVLSTSRSSRSEASRWEGAETSPGLGAL